MEKEFLEYIVEHAKEIVFGFGSNGMLRYANQSMKNALEYDCMEGMSLEDIFITVVDKSNQTGRRSAERNGETGRSRRRTAVTPVTSVAEGLLADAETRRREAASRADDTADEDDER